MRLGLLSLIAVLAASPALADEPMSTAGATGAALPAADTAAQIEQWIADSPAARPEPEGPMLEAARKVHGEMGVSIGTGGYRSGYVVTHIPIGETGGATIALSKTDYGSLRGPILRGPERRVGYLAQPAGLAQPPLDGAFR